MLERLVPPSIACAETTGDRLDIDLFDAEREAVARAVEKRRREFVTGRACARRALARLGAPIVAIPRGARGEPMWPAGVVGSITHCRGFRGCAVAWSEAVLALGIDAEPNGPLPPGVAEEVLHGPEQELAERRPARGTPDPGAVDLPRLVFSAKEAVYKAWFPLTGRWLGFEDAEVSFAADGPGFHVRLLVPGPVVGGAQLTGFDGRWTLQDGIIATAVVVARDP